MKNKLLLMLLFITTIAYAQVPSYYNDVDLTKNGTALKDELAVKIISTHSTYLSYTPGVWNALEEADADPNNSNNVLLLYGYNDTDGVEKTDRTRGKYDHGSGIGLWNREHSYPKSLGTPNLGTSGPGSDAHHLRACDGQMNSTRNNRMYADGSGNATITASGHFYPGDEWKGDVARMMLYMYLRYDDRCLPVNVGVGNTVAGDANMIDLFLEWNAEDPVNFFEDNRNEVLANIQGNRNPFIDNPAFATQIWGGVQAEDRFGNGSTDTEAPSVPLNLIASNTTATATQLSWSSASDNIGVTGYDIYENGVYIASVTNNTYNVSGLTAQTTYSYKVNAKDAAGNVSGFSANASVTTLSGAGTGTASELFISEYIEGSSNNKALEVANFTGNTVNLSGYELRKQTNGAGAWNTGYALSGSLNNGDVFVLAHSSATSTVTANADATTGSTTITFNGNDAVGLFKNDVLVDIIGVFNGGTANFAKDVTLRRKSSISTPNSNYTVSEWDSYSQNTFDNLGTHTIDGGGTTPTPDTTAPSIPANVVASNVTQASVDLSWTASTDDTAVTGYDIYQNGTLLTEVTTTNYVVTGLSASTTYSFTIQAKDGSGNFSASSNAVSVTTDTINVTYCNSKGNNVNYEYIDYVGLGGISNTTTANNGYGDFTNQTGAVNYGTNTIVLSVGFSSSSYTEYWKVWIDFNKNGTFESSEEVVSGSTSSSGNLSYNFNVPTSALSGNTRMRVSMKWDSSQTACETFSYGEVEDYTVNIGGGSARYTVDSRITIDGELGEEAKLYDTKIFTTSSVLNIKMEDNRPVNYTISNMLGQVIANGQFSKTLQLNNIEKGVYLLSINDGQRTIIKKFVKN